MKLLNIALFVFLFLSMVLPMSSQEISVVPKRTPEQEAAKQTEKLQEELNLNQDQANKVYEINLHYARERQISNKRSEALERMKNKNTEINQVLSPEQNERLQSKRYERTYLENNAFKRNPSINSSGFRPSPNFRTNQKYRNPATSGENIRKNFRPVNPNFHPGGQPNQPVRRSTTTVPSSNQRQNNTPSTRSTFRNNADNSRRTETGAPSRNNAHPQTPPANAPGRSATPGNPNRR